MVKRRGAAFLAILAAAALAGFHPTPAVASRIAHSSVVSTEPADFTPRVTTGTAVYKMLPVDGVLYAGGAFSQVQDAGRTTTYNRANLFAFSATTGAVSPFAPSFDGEVWALARAGGALYVGGKFESVNGVSRRGLVKLDLATGAVDQRFDARLTGDVTEAAVVGGRLIIAGSFSKRLAAVDLATGTDTDYIDLGISGTVASNAGPIAVYRFAVNPARTRLAAVGNFTTVGGRGRARAFMLDLGATSASLDPWYYEPLARMCAGTRVPDYLRDVDFSPDGSWFVIVSSGWIPQEGDAGYTVCDATARFETGVATPTRPTWINYTGGDSLHSVVATSAAVYVQGHLQRLDAAEGANGCGSSCVERPGIGAINPATGRALSWNPTKHRGVGGKDLLITTRGLWVASDTTRIGYELHERIAFLPLP